jgi:hypothetical protein
MPRSGSKAACLNRSEKGTAVASPSTGGRVGADDSERPCAAAGMVVEEKKRGDGTGERRAKAPSARLGHDGDRDTDERSGGKTNVSSHVCLSVPWSSLCLSWRGRGA